MKKLLLLFVILASSVCSSQELGENAEKVKIGFPEDYSAIREFSIKKWGDDHRMVLHEINKQSDAYVVIFEELYTDENLPIFLMALKKWGYTKEKGMEGNPDINWAMVKHEIETQLKAKEAY